MDFAQLGPYKIGPRLGKGGMGSVYRGANADTGQVAAIKALAPQLVHAEGFRERFEAEIESLKTLRHEGIVTLYGYGEEAGTLFYAMELVEGRSLEEELKAGRRFNWREVVDIAIQVCRALKHAHDHGIVHRDIKPANILLDQDDHAKLADFGIARLFGGTQLTMAGGVLGTADYMSPEQAEGKPVTAACDQYSLGCVMFALLAGRPPFQAKSLPEMLQLQRFAQPEPVRRYAPRAPQQLESLITQLLSKAPRDRFPNTLVLAKHLEAMRRALSRPFNASVPEPGDANGEPPTPLDMAETQAEMSADAASPELANSFDLAESLDIIDASDKDEPATIDSMPANEESETAPTPVKRQDHFIDVAGQRDGRSRQAIPQSVLASAAGLIVLVAAAGWLAWRLTQPYDVEALYQQIRPDLDQPSIEQLRVRESYLDEFLSRFPADPRAEEVEQYAQELELDRLERRFAALAKRNGGEEGLLTAERLYLDAVRLAESDPAAAAEQLGQLVALFDSRDAENLDRQTRKRLEACLEIAQRQLARLETIMAEDQQVDLNTLNERMAAAVKLHATQPDRAVAICQALVELYEDKPWAENVVGRARKVLAEWTAPEHSD